MNKLTFIFIIIAIIAIGAVLVMREGEPVETSLEEQKKEETEDVEEKSILTMVKKDANSQKTDLVAVDGSDSSGTAYRLVKDGVLYHGVEASMPDPDGENKYEGWLVQPSPLKFFSTGVMEKNEDGVWTLEYSVGEEFPTYNRVVITEETVVDATPEKHIIEGDFSIEDIAHPIEETINIKDFTFNPATINIKKGTTVIWTNQDSTKHTVTSDSGSELDSELLAKGETYSHQFNQTGTFNYHCTPHPFMEAKVIVE